MIELAEAIHNATCEYNHTDQCAWFYESWDRPGYDRSKALGQAKKLVELTSMDTAQLIVVLSALKEATR